MLAPPRKDDLLPLSDEDVAPADWPAPGPIDLVLHDPPHASSTLEWWYVNSHLETTEGREVSIFAAFFRQLVRIQPDGTRLYAHSVTFAFSEPKAQRYAGVVAVDGLAPELGLAKLRAAPQDKLSRPLEELLEKGKIPGPTRTFRHEATVASDELELDFDGNSLRRLLSGEYLLKLHDPERGHSCTLRFRPRKPPVRFGPNGVVSGVADEKMFYYFIPRCDVHGQLCLNGQGLSIERGSGWYDHEFGVAPKPKSSLRAVTEQQTSWRWASLQLSDGTDVSVYIITRGETVLDRWSVVTDARGQRQVHSSVELRPTRFWRSTRSFVEYPVEWTLEVPGAGLQMAIQASFDDQEVLTIISDPGFWEGRVDARGTARSGPVRGRGWVECKGFRFRSIDAFFGAVGKEVRARLGEVLPLAPTPSDAAGWALRRGAPVSDDLEAGTLAKFLAAPIREMTDRGGKAWRSYAALACIDVVGGDSRQFQHWLVMPELLHVGSLIIDDIEDRSTVRRGGPACHVLYGEACAINAGSASYFLAEPPLERDELPDADKVRIYQLYFDAMRAGHAGQALDLAGCADAAAAAATSGRTEQLERQVLAVHRLKTAVPAGCLARIGATLGGGTREQVRALGEFFEALGLAFQIMDDVLNLRGFENDLKQRGEDVRQGKVTLPIVMGFSVLPDHERTWLWRVLQSQPDADELVGAVIARLEECGAIERCVQMARELVDVSWARLDPLIADSQFKLVFRAFSEFVLERHY